jgi:small GTP-binding protein
MSEDNQDIVVSEVDNNKNDENQQQENGQERENERPTETNNNGVNRYTEVEDDFLSSGNQIEGLDQNDNNVLEESNKEKNENQNDVTIINTMEQNPLYNNKQRYNLKIIVVGDIAVGKTCFIHRYISNTFTEEHKSSLGCEYKQKQVDIDGETSANLQIWDTAGEERFMSVTRQYYKDSHGAMVVYDLTNEKTFKMMDKWIKELKDNAPKNIAIMIVGNKSDLFNEKVDLGNELDRFKNEYLYCEVSAKSGTNVSLAFENLTLKIIENEKEKKLKGEDIPRKTVALKATKHKKKKCVNFSIKKICKY